jgi:uncharacterized protein YoxC
MFNTSRDILNLVLALSIAGFTVFICWSLYYLIASLRSIFRVIKEIEATVEKIGDLTRYIRDKIENTSRFVGDLGDKANDLFKTVKDKLNNTGSYLMIIGEVLKRIFDFMQDRNETKTTRKTSKR